MEVSITNGISYHGHEAMTEELKQAIANATHMCRNKLRATDGSRFWNVQLNIVKGCNIYNSQIELRDKATGEVVAYFAQGDFYTVRRYKITLLL